MSPTTRRKSATIPLREQTAQVWHNYFPDIIPGQLYGYRVHGPFEPKQGHRFNPKKLLLDPYAKAIGRDLKWDDSLFAYQLDHPDADLTLDERDSCTVCSAGGRCGHRVHLGRRSSAADALAQDVHL